MIYFEFMREIARLKELVFDEQINTPVPAALKERFKRLKSAKKIDTAEEIRKALYALATDLESAVGITDPLPEVVSRTSLRQRA